MLIKTRNEFIAKGLDEDDVKKTRAPGYIRSNPRTSYLIENGTEVRVHLDTGWRISSCA